MKCINVKLSPDDFKRVLSEVKFSDTWDEPYMPFNCNDERIYNHRDELYQLIEHFDLETDVVYAFEYFPFMFEIKE